MCARDTQCMRWSVYIAPVAGDEKIVACRRSLYVDMGWE